MFKYLIVVLLIIAFIQMATADWACDISEEVCRTVVCVKCKQAKCINHECICSLCS